MGGCFTLCRSCERLASRKNAHPGRGNTRGAVRNELVEACRSVRFLGVPPHRRSECARVRDRTLHSATTWLAAMCVYRPARLAGASQGGVRPLRTAELRRMLGAMRDVSNVTTRGLSNAVFERGNIGPESIAEFCRIHKIGTVGQVMEFHRLANLRDKKA